MRALRCVSFRGHVAAHGRDSQEFQLVAGRERQQQCDGVVLPWVAVDNDFASHLLERQQQSGKRGTHEVRQGRGQHTFHAEPANNLFLLWNKHAEPAQ